MTEAGLSAASEAEEKTGQMICGTELNVYLLEKIKLFVP